MREIVLLKVPLKSFANLLGLIVGAILLNKLNDWNVIWGSIFIYLIKNIINPQNTLTERETINH